MNILFIAQMTTSQQNKISEVVHNLDPYGIGIAAIGMGVVFISLLLLYITFYNVSKLLVYRTKRNLQKHGKEEEAGGNGIQMDADVNAAIAMAMYLYFQEVHDKESAVPTINRISRSYSPWSSKIYGIRQNPR
jgi:glutaconyl-CoA/methylmalonyl-CoA decarboxylase subunit delta